VWSERAAGRLDGLHADGAVGAAALLERAELRQDAGVVTVRVVVGERAAGVAPAGDDVGRVRAQLVDQRLAVAQRARRAAERRQRAVAQLRERAEQLDEVVGGARLGEQGREAGERALVAQRRRQRARERGQRAQASP
jgi:hypothetical protein